MNDLDRYLDRIGQRPWLVPDMPPPGLNMVVVIPSFAEENLPLTLESLAQCTFLPRFHAEVIVVFNCPARASAEEKRLHKKSIRDVEEWIRYHANPSLTVHLVHAPAVPPKYSGVGHARKTGMDEGIVRFLRAGREDGILISLDADTLVDGNYFAEIDCYFTTHLQREGCAIYYEHSLKGDDYPPDVYQAITDYEIHLRYHVGGVKYAGSPYAFHTLGSAFAVRASAYARLGGMKARQGAEDFYFLQKIMDLGKFGELNETRVIPSPRPSGRVPFGTGPVVTEWIRRKDHSFSTYAFEAYGWLRNFFRHVNRYYLLGAEETEDLLKETLHPAIGEFLLRNGFPAANEEINRNVASLASYRKRFFRWFNGFRTVKYLNDVHTRFVEKQPVTQEAVKLLNALGIKPQQRDAAGLLEVFRKLDREGYKGITLPQ
ncbi:MAG TPA: glycosyltransferase family 2 protein [Bacteroidetes bacterium]|nr:glycosyltransferase family 2 protein [Bacteroidota bacterium]